MTDKKISEKSKEDEDVCYLKKMKTIGTEEVAELESYSDGSNGSVKNNKDDEEPIVLKDSKVTEEDARLEIKRMTNTPDAMT